LADTFFADDLNMLRGTVQSRLTLLSGSFEVHPL